MRVRGGQVRTDSILVTFWPIQMKCKVETVSALATAAVTVRALVKYTCTYCCTFTRGGGLHSLSAFLVIRIHLFVLCILGIKLNIA